MSVATVDHLLASYSPPAGEYDEYVAADGRVRTQARAFVDELQQLGLAELRRRRELAWRQIAENSVTLSPSGVGEESNRPWEFDVLPLMIAAEDWQHIAAGLTQRARLLNLILADIYGEQQIFRRGLVPPQLLFAHPGYWRSCHDLSVPDDVYLHLYAADLARGPDGRWRVLSDRTESPSGLGYALENRLVASGMYPDSFRADQVERLAPFFIALRELLQRQAVAHQDNPRVVLLSQGPSNPNYYEDAYLSRYLGYMVVEGGDLAVRHDRVLLKTLGGLLPVDVILRRVDDGDCDPLELRGDSARGVAGLVHAARSRHVVLANALGCGLLEAPVWAAYLPGLCRALLSEDLQLPSVATWWCGAEDARNYVLDDFDQLVIRHSYRDSRQATWFVDELSARQRDELKTAIRARPGDYVGQAPVRRSTSPVWLHDAVDSWSVGLRTYLVAAGKSYTCLPGGLARVSPQSRTLDLSISRGAGSKDAWVLAAGPVAPVTLLKPPGYIQELKRSGAELPSRVADNLFWMGRHAERAEGAARLLRTIVTRLTGEGGGVGAPDVPVLLRALAELGQIEPGYAVEEIRPQLPEIERVLPAIVFDLHESNSLRSTLTQLNRTASLVRERLSLDSWRLINRVHHEFHPGPAGGDGDLPRLHAQLNQLIIDLSALSGLVAESMTRTLGWRFLDIGRRLERSQHNILLVRNLLLPLSGRDAAVLEAALEVADSLLTYRARYLTNLQLAPVLDLLITDETNPRSLAFQLVALAEHVEHLPRDSNQPLRNQEQRLCMTLLHNVRMLSADALIGMHAPTERSSLDRALARVASQLPKLANFISHKYLIHAGLPRQLTELRPRRNRPD